MCKLMRKWGRTVVRRSLNAMTLVVLMSGFACYAQFTDTCMPINDLRFDTRGEITDPSGNIIWTTMWPIVWAPGKTYEVSIKGGFPVASYPSSGSSGCPNVFISAWQWADAPNPYEVGAISQDVTLSNLTYVSPTLSTFTASVSSSAQPGEHVFFQLNAWIGYLLYWDVDIQPPPPPVQPSPPLTPRCSVPTIASVTPATWLAGETYPITVTGTGFTTAANATDSCPISVITVSVNAGTVTLSNVNVIDSTTITATVTPADTDPEEPAEVILWAPYNVIDDDDDVEDDVNAEQIPGNATPRPNISSGSAPPGYIQAGQARAKITTLPFRETSSKSGNSMPPIRSGTLFKAKLFGKTSYIKFDGRTVSEQDAGKGSGDCKTNGLLPFEVNYFAHPTVSGGSWTVAGKVVGGGYGDYTGQTNTYGDDGIDIPTSWLPAIVFRNPTGCTVTLIQNMLISCDTDSGPGSCKYWTNKIVLTIKPIPGDEDHNGTASATRSGTSPQ